jgi:ribonuclease E
VGGIVVIDFIDMVLESNRELVLRRLLECLARDRTKHQVAEVTSLGLVQMTRKRVGAGLLEAFSTPCECCNGRGVILTFDPDTDGNAAHHTHQRGHGGNGASRSRDHGAAASPALVAAAARARPGDAPPPGQQAADGQPATADVAEPAAGPAAQTDNGQAEPTRSSRRRRRKPSTAAAEAPKEPAPEPAGAADLPAADDGAA